jgi:DNA-3-methyladenine glycosylase II
VSKFLLNMEKTAEKFLCDADPILAEIIAAIPTPEIESTDDVFFDLMSCVLEQQIHYRSTKKIFKKMLERAGLETLTTENFHEFEEKGMSGISLSLSKCETAYRIAEFFDENKIDWQSLSDEEVRATFSQIKGIAKWSIDMILLYTLNRPNVFPSDDFHLKQVMISLYKLDEKNKLKSQMTAIANRWGEHKSLAVKYLLGWKEFQKKLPKIKK